MSEFAKVEWEQFKSSKTVKFLVATEAAAVGLFIQDVIAGTQKLDVGSLKVWLLLQAGIIIAALMRQTWAGIEAKLDGAVDPAIVESIHRAAEKKFLQKLESNPTLATAVKDHLTDNI